ncbi:MAG: MipA/OmpV family protein [Pseudomonadales bacterium]
MERAVNQRTHCVTRRTMKVLCAVFMLVGLPQIVAADSERADNTPAIKNWSLGLALGAGQRSNPLISGDDIDLWWTLDFAWFGDRWFFDNGDLGYLLKDHSAFTLNWIARVNTERAFFSGISEGLFRGTEFGVNSPVVEQGADAPVLEEEAAISIPDRDYALETGLEILSSGLWGNIHGQILGDVSGVHNGYEAWLSYSADWISGRWHFSPSLSVNWKSKKQNDYYYGVRASEAQNGLSAYQAESGFNTSAKLSAVYYLSKRWRFFASANIETINDSAADSPLLKDDQIVSYFAGIHYAF